jgi:hypothetical protein
MRTKRAIAAAVALVATLTVTAGAVSGVTGAKPRLHSAADQLAGTWIVKVNRPAPLPPLTSLQVFTRAGSMIENANEPSATRTEAYGSWKRLHGRLYATTTLFFRFNPQTGAWLGTTKVDRTIEVAQDGQSFTVVARVTMLDPGGNTIATFPATASGQRMQVEPIAGRP